MSVENSTLIYDQYLELNLLDNLNAEKLNELINLHANLAFISDSFLKIRKDTLIHLLQSNSLLIDEIVLFSASVRWIKAELQRKNQETNVKNQLTLFNSIKHLIRFGLMSKDDFFGIKLPKEYDGANKPIAPAKSKLFTDDELKEFEIYFETKDSKVLSTNYNFNKRNDLKIGKLVYDWRAGNYRMMNIDEQLSNEDGNFVYFENGCITDDLLKETNHTNRFQNQTTNRVDNVSTNDEDMLENFSINKRLLNMQTEDNRIEEDKPKDEIYIFKIQKCGGNSTFEKDVSFRIDAKYNHYHSNAKGTNEIYHDQNQMSYMAFYPAIPLALKKYFVNFYNSKYNHTFGKVDLRLKSIFNNDRQLDVQLDILNQAKTCVWQIYFYYK